MNFYIAKAQQIPSLVTSLMCEIWNTKNKDIIFFLSFLEI